MDANEHELLLKMEAVRAVGRARCRPDSQRQAHYVEMGTADTVMKTRPRDRNGYALRKGASCVSDQPFVCIRVNSWFSFLNQKDRNHETE